MEEVQLIMREIMEEIVRVVRPGGRVVVTGPGSAEAGIGTYRTLINSLGDSVVVVRYGSGSNRRMHPFLEFLYDSGAIEFRFTDGSPIVDPFTGKVVQGSWVIYKLP